MNRVTLARALSKLGAASRSEARTLIEAGRVTVNSRVVRSPDAWIDIVADVIEMDGERIKREAFCYVMLHKPRGSVTTRRDERGRKTVYDLLPTRWQKLFPIGRLDLDSSGLLLFTNDTQWGERITSPAQHVAKTYVVTLDAPLADEHLAAMEKQVELEDGTQLLPARVKVLPGARCEITIDEGKNRQIRRLCEHLGYQAIALHRIRIGALGLGDLAEGEAREIDRSEV